MFEVSHKELDNILVQINQAIDNHNQWYQQLVRTLICKLPPDQRDIDDEAFRLCRFGQWYYQYSNPGLRSHPTFASLEIEHRRLHEEAIKLLQLSAAGMNLDTLKFDAFANTLERMRLLLFSLQHEIEGELNNLDPLTGTYTRYGMLAVLRDQQELVNRKASQCSIAMLDLDFFKQVNDQYGHRAGDQALAKVSSVLLKGLRPYDKLFRYGGEEFVAMFPNTSIETAMVIADRLRKMVEDTTIELDGLPIRMTISLGVALISSDVSVETTIEQADSAMYEAKKLGRNQTKLWMPPPQSEGNQ